MKAEIFLSGAIIVMMVGIMYFMIIKPQKKQEQQHKLLLESLKKGDKVILSSGLYGIIDQLHNETVHIRVASGALLKFEEQAIIRIQEVDAS